ncbi:MAG TPA: hypothetical protein PLQ57_13500, partial [Saprospiraceae bacterium]|nr:hypothetical protein [Saprospiraceae bacterium]
MFETPLLARVILNEAFAGFIKSIHSHASPTGLTFPFLSHRTSYGVIHFEALAGFFMSNRSNASPTGLTFPFLSHRTSYG